MQFIIPFKTQIITFIITFKNQLIPYNNISTDLKRVFFLPLYCYNILYIRRDYYIIDKYNNTNGLLLYPELDINYNRLLYQLDNPTALVLHNIYVLVVTR